MVINPIIGFYLPIIRIPIKGWMTIPNIATFDHGTFHSHPPPIPKRLGMPPMVFVPIFKPKTDLENPHEIIEIIQPIYFRLFIGVVITYNPIYNWIRGPPCVSRLLRKHNFPGKSPNGPNGCRLVYPRTL